MPAGCACDESASWFTQGPPSLCSPGPHPPVLPSPPNHLPKVLPPKATTLGGTIPAFEFGRTQTVGISLHLAQEVRYVSAETGHVSLTGRR